MSGRSILGGPGSDMPIGGRACPAEYTFRRLSDTNLECRRERHPSPRSQPTAALQPHQPILAGGDRIVRATYVLRRDCHRRITGVFRLGELPTGLWSSPATVVPMSLDCRARPGGAASGPDDYNFRPRASAKRSQPKRKALSASFYTVRGLHNSRADVTSDIKPKPLSRWEPHCG